MAHLAIARHRSIAKRRYKVGLISRSMRCVPQEEDANKLRETDGELKSLQAAIVSFQANDA